MHRLYITISYFLIPLIIINTYIRVLKKKEDKSRYKERFGITKLLKPRNKELIWIHASSVGEFKSKISQDAEYTFTIPGIYAYICSPHKTGKMLGFVIVGNDKSNLEDIKALKYRGMSKKFAKQLIEDIENNY